MRSHIRVYRSAFLTFVLLGAGACAGSGDPLAENYACFRALDCQPGLVCVEGRCTDDIAPIVPEGAGAATEEEPEPESAPDAG